MYHIKHSFIKCRWKNTRKKSCVPVQAIHELTTDRKLKQIDNTYQTFEFAIASIAISVSFERVKNFY